VRQNNTSARKGQPFNKMQNLEKGDNNGRENIRFRNKATVACWELCKYIHADRVRGELSRGAIDCQAMHEICEVTKLIYIG